MEIRINGLTADITPENEKTVGEILASIESWLVNSGHRLSGLILDGETASADNIEKFFSKEINNVKSLDILTNSMAELTAESLLNILADIKEFESLDFKEKNDFIKRWEKTAQARFAQEQMADLYYLYKNAFSSGDVSTGVIYNLTEEMLREVKDPMQEFCNLKPVVDDICKRLVDLPLDIQTGRDSHAAMTIQIFSSLSEKIFRILNQFNSQGFLLQKKNEEKPIAQVISDFGTLVKDLHSAYERQDTVLVGDLAEYEASEKLLELYNAILKNCHPVSIEKEKK